MAGPLRLVLASLAATATLVLLVVPGAASSQARHPGSRPPRVGVTWHSTGPPVTGAPAVLVTTLHPDPLNPATVAYVGWVDHTRAEIALYPGFAQPPVASPRGPAEVPNGERWRLLATFNGGFKYGSTAGDNGFAVDGHTYVWLKPGLGTLVGYRNGRVDVVRWRGSPTPPPSVAFARQNLPLIVDRGRPAAGLDNRLAWGATLGGAAAVWRTGVGVDRRGNLLYVAASDQTPAGLAAVMIRAGAIRAIELDINPEWPTFNVYSHRGGLDPRMFVPNSQQTPMRYLTPDARDFFAVYRRIGGPVSVPFR